MKICAVVSEYNPFHNGHLYHLNEIKKRSLCDTLICIMSGDYTQRGEIAMLNKYQRARHAILGGADMVIELPTVFATAPAEIFASGAIKLLSEIPAVEMLSFGCEKGTKETFLSTAKALLTETKEFKNQLKEELKGGKSLAKAKADAIKALSIEGVDLELLDTPNSILGIEYTKAILSLNSKIDILPIERIGGGYNDTKVYNNFSSASSIRESIKFRNKKAVKHNVPSFVYKDIDYVLPEADDYIFYSLLTRKTVEMASVMDCSEGLENRIKALMKDSLSLNELIEKITTKRYTKARIKRICMSVFLNINEEFVRKCLKNDLYLKVLGISDKRMDLLSEIKNTCKLPLLTRKSDYRLLNDFQTECFDKDTEAGDIYNYITKQKNNEHIMPIVKI